LSLSTGLAGAQTPIFAKQGVGVTVRKLAK